MKGRVTVDSGTTGERRIEEVFPDRLQHIHNRQPQVPKAGAYGGSEWNLVMIDLSVSMQV